MAAKVTSRPARGRVIIPCSLTVPAVDEGHGGGVEIDQVQLFTAMRVVAGVAGRSPIIVQVFLMVFEIGIVALSQHIDIVTVAIKTDFSSRYPR